MDAYVDADSNVDVKDIVDAGASAIGPPVLTYRWVKGRMLTGKQRPTGD